jgi:chromosome segregation ATPase
MTAASRPPDDTPPGVQAVEDLAKWTPAPVAPDDTPTRLQHADPLHARLLEHALRNAETHATRCDCDLSVVVRELTATRAEVSRLREALQAAKQSGADNHHNALTCAYCNPNSLILVAEADVSRLQHRVDEAAVWLSAVRSALGDDTLNFDQLPEAVSRLQQEHATVYTFLSRIIDVVAPSNPTAGGKTMTLCQQVDHYIVELREENALLRRSLEMLTKQLDEKDERITELTFTIIRHNSPA